MSGDEQPLNDAGRARLSLSSRSASIYNQPWHHTSCILLLALGVGNIPASGWFSGVKITVSSTTIVLSLLGSFLVLSLIAASYTVSTAKRAAIASHARRSTAIAKSHRQQPVMRGLTRINSPICNYKGVMCMLLLLGPGSFGATSQLLDPALTVENTAWITTLAVALIFIYAMYTKTLLSLGGWCYSWSIRGNTVL